MELKKFPTNVLSQMNTYICVKSLKWFLDGQNQAWKLKASLFESDILCDSWQQHFQITSAGSVMIMKFLKVAWAYEICLVYVLLSQQ